MEDTGIHNSILRVYLDSMTFELSQNNEFEIYTRVYTIAIADNVINELFKFTQLKYGNINTKECCVWSHFNIMGFHPWVSVS